MEEVLAFDTMCRPTYSCPELAKDKFQIYEYKTMANNTFAGVKEKWDIEDGEEWKIFERLGNNSVEETIEEMDDVGVEKIFMDQAMIWSRRESRICISASIEKLNNIVEKSNGRIIPGVGYNPNRIQESLERIERAVDEFNFKYVWFNPITFGIRPTNEKCYPLYSKCVELDIPVCYQTGQSAEPLPSEPGKPMYADEIPMDFPELTLVLTHAGWPWSMEWVSMLWRHPNVYGNIGGYYPSFLPDDLVEFMDSGRIRDKVMWATNGLGLKRCKDEFLDLPLRDKTQKRILRENALKVFDI